MKASIFDSMNNQPLLNKYEIISLIGEGGFGVVFKAREISTKNIVTIKRIKKMLGIKDIPQLALTEINLLKELKGSSNIIDLIDVQINDSKKAIYLVYNYCEYDIEHLIYNETKISVQQTKSYFKQMILALKNLHAKGYIHHDVKPKNFLLSSGNVIKLIDFGLSMKQKKDIIAQRNNNKNSINIIGTLRYIAPEILLGKSNYSTEIDVWSLGCTFYEMITKENLFSNCNTDSEIANRIIQIFGFPYEEEWPEFYTLPNKDIFLSCTKHSTMTADEFFDGKLPCEFRRFKNLLINMLQLNPKKRISLSDAIHDSILADAILPEKLPLFSANEKNHKSIFRTPSDKKSENVKNLFNELRPKKIVPTLII